MFIASNAITRQSDKIASTQHSRLSLGLKAEG